MWLKVLSMNVHDVLFLWKRKRENPWASLIFFMLSGPNYRQCQALTPLDGKSCFHAISIGIIKIGKLKLNTWGGLVFLRLVFLCIPAFQDFTLFIRRPSPKFTRHSTSIRNYSSSGLDILLKLRIPYFCWRQAPCYSILLYVTPYSFCIYGPGIDVEFALPFAIYPV